MSDFSSLIRRNFKMSAETVIYDLKQKKNPDEFIYNGSQMFHGMQGEGKTVSMYKYCMDIFHKYRRSVIVTNLNLSNLTPIHVDSVFTLNSLQDYDSDYWRDKYIYVETFDDVMKALRTARNGIYGVIFMIDEIHTYFHSHDSKSMPMWVQKVFSMQRKQHLVVLGTVQDWQDVTRMIRTQARNLILCHKIGYFITNTVVDPRSMEMEYGEEFFPIKRKGFFFLTKTIRDGIDTFQVIDSGREVMGNQELSNGIKKQKNGTIRRTPSPLAAMKKSKKMET